MKKMLNLKTKKRIVQKIAEISYENCKVCSKSQRIAMYKFRHQQFTSHIPELLEPVCRKCVYKEVYGNKNFLKKMRERSLDE